MSVCSFLIGGKVDRLSDFQGVDSVFRALKWVSGSPRLVFRRFLGAAKIGWIYSDPIQYRIKPLVYCLLTLYPIIAFRRVSYLLYYP